MKFIVDRVFTFGFLFFAFILLLSASAFAQNEFLVDSTNLTVYRDGLIHFAHEIVVNETDPAITIPLFSSLIDNIIIVDENQKVLDYHKDGVDLTIFTFGTKTVSLEYDSISLTNKKAEIWTLLITNPYNSSVYLPEDATIIYLSKIPEAIDTVNNKIMLSLSQGYWEISYILPLSPLDEPTDNVKHSGTIPIEYLFAVIILIVVFFLMAFCLYRRRTPNIEKIYKIHQQLNQEEKEVIKFLAEKQGNAFEAEIRERFPDLPRTSLWRLVRRLEKLEIVRIKKIGNENRVELKK